MNAHKGMDFIDILKNITNFVSTKYCFIKSELSSFEETINRLPLPNKKHQIKIQQDT